MRGSFRHSYYTDKHTLQGHSVNYAACKCHIFSTPGALRHITENPRSSKTTYTHIDGVHTDQSTHNLSSMAAPNCCSLGEQKSQISSRWETLPIWSEARWRTNTAQLVFWSWALPIIHRCAHHGNPTAFWWCGALLFKHCDSCFRCFWWYNPATRAILAR